MTVNERFQSAFVLQRTDGGNAWSRREYNLACKVTHRLFANRFNLFDKLVDVSRSTECKSLAGHLFNARAGTLKAHQQP